MQIVGIHCLLRIALEISKAYLYMKRQSEDVPEGDSENHVCTCVCDLQCAISTT